MPASLRRYIQVTVLLLQLAVSRHLKTCCCVIIIITTTITTTTTIIINTHANLFMFHVAASDN